MIVGGLKKVGFLCSNWMWSGSGVNFMIGCIKKALDRGMFVHFCVLNNIYIFVCVQTWFVEWSSFCLNPSHYRVAFLDADALWNFCVQRKNMKDWLIVPYHLPAIRGCFSLSQTPTRALQEKQVKQKRKGVSLTSSTHLWCFLYQRCRLSIGSVVSGSEKQNYH